MQRRQGRSEPDRTTGAEHVLPRRKQRLELGRPAPRPARDEEVDRRLVQVIGEPDRRPHVPSLRLGIARVLRGLDGGLDVAVEEWAVAVGDPAASLRLRHRDEDPRLAVAAARRERPRLAHLADQRRWYGVGTQAAQRARGPDALEKRDVLADGRDVDHAHTRLKTSIQSSIASSWPGTSWTATCW